LELELTGNTVAPVVEELARSKIDDGPACLLAPSVAHLPSPVEGYLDLPLLAAISGSSAVARFRARVPLAAPDAAPARLLISDAGKWQFHGDEVSGMQCCPHPDLPLVAAIDDDGTLCIFHRATGKPLAITRGAHTSLGSCVAWRPLHVLEAPTGTLQLQLLSAGFDNRIVLWHVEVTCAGAGGGKAGPTGGAGSRHDDADSGGFGCVAVAASRGGKGGKAGGRSRKGAPAAAKTAGVAGGDGGGEAAGVITRGGVEVLLVKLSKCREWDTGRSCAVVRPGSGEEEGGSGLAALLGPAPSGRAGRSARAAAGSRRAKGAAKADPDCAGSAAPAVSGAAPDAAAGRCAAASEAAAAAPAAGGAEAAGVAAASGADAPPSGAQEQQEADSSRFLNPPFVHQVAWLPLGAHAADGSEEGPEGLVEGDGAASAAFVVAAGDGFVYVVHADSGRTLAAWQAHAAAATCVAVAPATRLDAPVASTASGSGARWEAAAVRTPLCLITAGNDRRLCLWRLELAAVSSSSAHASASEAETSGVSEASDAESGLASAARRAAASPALPFKATCLWSRRHVRGGINSITALALAPRPAPAEVALAPTSMEHDSAPGLCLLVADVTGALSAYSWR